MKNLIRNIAVCVFLFSAYGTHAQFFKNLENQATKDINGLTGKKTTNNNGSGNSFNNISNTDATAAIKQALQIGAKNASNRLSTVNGFFGNAAIKVLMPPEAKNVETSLREVGMGSHVDKAILAMNRAAEDASSKAVPIFIDAITHMSIDDGISILKGGKGAATKFLQNATTAQLTAAFKPVIKASLDKVNATKYWAEIFKAYDKIPFTQKVNTDLPAYVTERALNGLFIALAEEENKIRTDPAAQVTDLLKNVFGGH